MKANRRTELGALCQERPWLKEALRGYTKRVKSIQEETFRQCHLDMAVGEDESGLLPRVRVILVHAEGDRVVELHPGFSRAKKHPSFMDWLTGLFMLTWIREQVDGYLFRRRMSLYGALMEYQANGERLVRLKDVDAVVIVHHEDAVLPLAKNIHVMVYELTSNRRLDGWIERYAEKAREYPGGIVRTQ